MRLKRLELSGFKSFAKASALEFPGEISAVVGPNGSGKSNIADSVRWVLGEQSIKSLRGKRGEDLIFSGSPSAPKLSKASVNLIFDNSKKEFPIEFDEVAIGRRVYRDGVNDYLLNGSEVRLKDIVELLAKVGFGSSQHHIIGQGEADRILYASGKERREMIEDALGLKIFQLKRDEAERKLLKTEDNIKQVETLRKEIQPHLKFLKAQTEKFEIASKLREDLTLFLEEYLSNKSAIIKRDLSQFREKETKPKEELKKIESEISKLRISIEKETERPAKNDSQLMVLAEKLRGVRERRVSAERELGRLEGMIGLEESNLRERKGAVISRSETEDIFSRVESELLGLESESALESVLRKVKELRALIADFLKNIKGERPSESKKLADYRKNFSELKARLETLKKEEDKFIKKYDEGRLLEKNEADEARRDERRVYELERESGNLKDILRGLELESAKVKLQEEEFKRELEEAYPYLGKTNREKKTSESGLMPKEELENLRKKVERTKIKLEEAGGIDPEVVKEFKEVSGRDEFLSKELTDLGGAATSLREVMKELGEKLESDFKEGISKINGEFQKFFETMFGGGKAELKFYSKVMRKKRREEGLEEEDIGSALGKVSADEEGIDISVDLPRKRIKSLDMLSGGERALTSIALLFAMSAVNPPPFLVLDETDAALDEANSQRYAEMLENLSKTTQLIVITHNRETMKHAGILYGITMGKDGTSKLLSLKFEEAGALIE